MREIKIADLMTLCEGTTVEYNVINDDNYIITSGYITILDTRENNPVILDNGKKSRLNEFIKIAERQMDDIDYICYKLFVIETPYEKMWNALNEIIKHEQDYYNNPPEFNTLTLHEQSEGIRQYNFLVDVIHDIEKKYK